MGAGGLAPAEQRGDAIDGGEPHEAVDDPAGRVRRAEVLAEEPGHEVELGDRDQTPIEAADDEQRSGNDVQRVSPSNFCSSSVHIFTVAMRRRFVKVLSKCCITSP